MESGDGAEDESCELEGGRDLDVEVGWAKGMVFCTDVGARYVSVGFRRFVVVGIEDGGVDTGEKCVEETWWASI